MPDQLEKMGPPEGEGGPAGSETALPQRNGDPVIAAGEARSVPRKRKAPIVNRRGPSEIDWALRMSRTSGGARPAPPRKVADGTVSRGTVIRLDRAKGFGFLVDAAGEHRFFHRTAVLDNGFPELKEQQTVEFEAHNDERGARALKVRPAGSAPPSTRPSQRTDTSPRTAKGNSWRSDLSPFRNGSGAPSRRKPPM